MKLIMSNFNLKIITIKIKNFKILMANKINKITNSKIRIKLILINKIKINIIII